MSEFDDYLTEGEQLIYTAEGENEYLGFTNKKIIYLGFVGIFGHEKIKDIRYSHISSTSFRFTSYPLLLLAAVALGILGFLIVYKV